MHCSGSVIKFEGQTKLGYFQVIDQIYSGRKARVLYSTNPKNAQSGIPLDDSDEMLFGYSQRLTEIVSSTKPANVLIIGGGVYTLASHIIKNFKSQVDVIEPDEELDLIASKYFGLKSSTRLRIIHTTGLNYLKNNEKLYDLIVVDAYNGDKIANELYKRVFARNLKKSLSNNGLVAINVISDLKLASPLKKLINLYNSYFKLHQAFPAEPGRYDYFFTTNYILVTSQLPQQLELRYAPLSDS